MSKFFSEKYATLSPYVPGEQPKEREYVKLNTNESPFPPSPLAVKLAEEELKKSHLYCDPECKVLVHTASEYFRTNEDEILFTNGSDEILNFAFMAYCDKNTPAVFPNISYGFYRVFAEINGVPYREIPLKDDFSINIEDYFNAKGTIFIANPNAPTGIALTPLEIEKILQNNSENVVVIDEAYVDFGGESVISLIKKYDNLLVTQTFSKSRSMAGARLGFGAANKDIINDLKNVKYSTNPYNVNRATAAAGVGAITDDEYFKKNCLEIIANRERLTKELKALGFTATQSQTNFVFVKSNKIGGKDLYLQLKKRGILVRHFDKEQIKDYNRITVGNSEQIDALLTAVKDILEVK